MTTPRVFILRHGETEWSLSGKHTGTSDIPLTSNGEKRVRATGLALVGPDRLIAPAKLKHIYVSPRKRAQRTLELMGLGCKEKYPWQKEEGVAGESVEAGKGAADRKTDARVSVDERICEWDYGEYEGVTSKEIAERREKNGEKEKWDIWTMGCPGGESPQDIIKRVDSIIDEIRERFHAPVMGKEGEDGDVLVVAHGHILRAFAMRWVGRNLDNTALIMEAGGVGTLSYEHKNVEEPAIVLGGGFVVSGETEKRIEKEEAEGKIG